MKILISKNDGIFFIQAVQYLLKRRLVETFGSDPPEKITNMNSFGAATCYDVSHNVEIVAVNTLKMSFIN
jgi:hypothetical protein